MLRHFFLFLSLFYLSSQSTQTEFLTHLTSALNIDANKETPVGTLSCDYKHGLLTVGCDNSKLVTLLSISDLKLPSIPNSIDALSSSLKTLTIFNAGIQNFGTGMQALTALNDLYLGGNKLDSFPPSLEKLSQITELNLFSNLIDVIPDWLSNFKNLQWLHLGVNQLGDIPSFFGSFTKLTALILDTNALMSLPIEFSGLTKLQTLYLSYNTDLDASTLLFEEMRDMNDLDVENSKIYGPKPVPGISMLCNNACVSSEECSKNDYCPCYAFLKNFCPTDCSWCDEGNTCLQQALTCQPCDSLKADECFLGCVTTEDLCTFNCDGIADESECSGQCFWCDMSNSCIRITQQCRTCDGFTAANCPSSCTSCEQRSTFISGGVLALVILLPCLLIIGVIVILVLFKKGVIKSDRSSTNEMRSTSNID